MTKQLYCLSTAPNKDPKVQRVTDLNEGLSVALTPFQTAALKVLQDTGHWEWASLGDSQGYGMQFRLLEYEPAKEWAAAEGATFVLPAAES